MMDLRTLARRHTPEKPDPAARRIRVWVPSESEPTLLDVAIGSLTPVARALALAMAMAPDAAHAPVVLRHRAELVDVPHLTRGDRVVDTWPALPGLSSQEWVEQHAAGIPPESYPVGLRAGTTVRITAGAQSARAQINRGLGSAAWVRSQLAAQDIPVQVWERSLLLGNAPAAVGTPGSALLWSQEAVAQWCARPWPGLRTGAEISRLLGIAPGTWRSYVARHRRPATPAPVVTSLGAPLWDGPTVWAWNQQRPGVGGRPPRAPVSVDEHPLW